MDKKNLMPQAAQPVNRTSTGQLPAELAELSEEALHDDSSNYVTHHGVLASYMSDPYNNNSCSYNGDDAE